MIHVEHQVSSPVEVFILSPVKSKTRFQIANQTHDKANRKIEVNNKNVIEGLVV